MFSISAAWTDWLALSCYVWLVAWSLEQGGGPAWIIYSDNVFITYSKIWKLAVTSRHGNHLCILLRGEGLPSNVSWEVLWFYARSNTSIGAEHNYRGILSPGQCGGQEENYKNIKLLNPPQLVGYKSWEIPVPASQEIEHCFTQYLRVVNS